MTIGRGLFLCAGLAFGGFGLTAPAAHAANAADVGKEVATAEQHAGYAAAAKDLKGAHTHLHHVVNCLVGPMGKGFDEKELNPCKDLGNGAIPDTKEATEKKELQQALGQARAGLKAEKLAAAQKDAGAVEAALKKTM